MTFLKNKDIVCFAAADWHDPLWTNRQHIMSRLASRNRILFVESVAVRPPNISRKGDLKKLARKIKTILRPLRKVTHNVYALSPFIVPFWNYSFIRKLNLALLRFQIYRSINALGLKESLLWAYLPLAVDLCDSIQFSTVIYHCVDDHEKTPGVPSDLIGKLERELIKRANFVFVTSKKLLELKDAGSGNIYYLPNVADFTHFSKASKENTVIPDDIAGLKRPILGYVGNMCDHKFDPEIVEKLSENAEWTIVLIGPIWERNVVIGKRLCRLRKKDNIHFLGYKSYRDLPSYIKAFDVCIVPHKITPYSESSFPLKFHEFLASGKPIVSSTLPAIEEYKNIIYFAENSKDFVKDIEAALVENDPLKKEKRISIASENTWEDRIHSIDSILAENPGVKR